MSESRFIRVGDSAYFSLDHKAFNSTILMYDPIIANQTILSTCGDYLVQQGDSESEIEMPQEPYPAREEDGS